MGHYANLGDATVLTDPADLDPTVLANSYIPIYGPDVPATPPAQAGSSWVLPALAVGALVLTKGGKRLLDGLRARYAPRQRTITVPGVVRDA